MSDFYRRIRCNFNCTFPVRTLILPSDDILSLLVERESADIFYANKSVYYSIYVRIILNLWQRLLDALEKPHGLNFNNF